MKTLKNNFLPTPACRMIVLVGAVAAASACGVKGDPLPPEKAVELGRGRPTYQNADETISYPELPPVLPKDSEKKEKPQDESF
jgi:hypothetical protein